MYTFFKFLTSHFYEIVKDDSALEKHSDNSSSISTGFDRAGLRARLPPHDEAERGGPLEFQYNL